MFVFDGYVVEIFRARYASENEKHPSRVEALSAFIWSCYAVVTGPLRTYVVIHTVNLRPKKEPPLPRNSFGNYYQISMTIRSFNTREHLASETDIRNDSGIEAYVSLKVEDMTKFEADEELLACVSKAPVC
ncbi:hypothetical protein JHK82_022122 [Glycine max]|nr:hypothetical protein JHK82_022122 [Glycine max]